MNTHALKIALVGTFLGPPLLLVIGILLYAMSIALAVLCIVLFPVMGIFFPQKLIEFTRATDEDRTLAAKIDKRLRWHHG